MTRNMYWISAMCYAIVLLIILIKEKQKRGHSDTVGRSFSWVLYAALFNSLQDLLWGLCFCHIVNSPLLYFISSEVFHVSCVATLFFWLYFILDYMKCREPIRTILLTADGIFVATETVLAIANIFTPTLFSIVDGEYEVERYRPLTFIFQYVIYLMAGIFTMVRILRDSIRHTEFNLKHWAVFSASGIPILLGVFQYRYTTAPLYSMALTLSCLVMYVYVVAMERENLQHSKELFLQNMSHEIRTSLNSVYGFAQLLSLPDGTWTEEERKRYTSHIHSSYNMLDMLLNDLMVSTRYDTHKYSVKISMVDVTMVCQEAIEAVNACKPASVSVRLTSGLPEGFTIESDGRRIRQIVQNLLTNACQFINKGKITVDVRAKGNDEIEFSVTDDSPFSHGHTFDTELSEKRQSHREGLGLRLRISQRMAELIGGRVYHDIEYKAGTRHVLVVGVNAPAVA